MITDNLSSHNSVFTRTWLEDHRRIRHVFIPAGTCWLNLQESRWCIFPKAALAGNPSPSHPSLALGMGTKGRRRRTMAVSALPLLFAIRRQSSAWRDRGCFRR